MSNKRKKGTKAKNYFKVTKTGKLLFSQEFHAFRK